MSTEIPTTIVIPTVGRSTLADLLVSLHACAGPRPAAIIIVDDRTGDETLAPSSIA